MRHCAAGYPTRLSGARPHVQRVRARGRRLRRPRLRRRGAAVPVAFDEAELDGAVEQDHGLLLQHGLQVRARHVGPLFVHALDHLHRDLPSCRPPRPAPRACRTSPSEARGSATQCLWAGASPASRWRRRGRDEAVGDGGHEHARAAYVVVRGQAGEGAPAQLWTYSQMLSACSWNAWRAAASSARTSLSTLFIVTRRKIDRAPVALHDHVGVVVRVVGRGVAQPPAPSS